MPGKTVVQKLQIKPGTKIAFVKAPSGYGEVLGPLPDQVKVLQSPDVNMDIIQVFVDNKKELELELPRLKNYLSPKGFIWVTYHKGTSEIKTDINRDTIFTYANTIGMTPVSQVAVNDDWSALRIKIL